MAKICASCKEVIKTTKSGLLCEVSSCGEWHHTKCLASGQQAKEKQETQWRCPKCRAPPLVPPVLPPLKPALLSELGVSGTATPSGNSSPAFGTPTGSPGPFSINYDMGNLITKLQQDVAKVLANQAAMQQAVLQVQQAQEDIKKTQEDVKKSLDFYGEKIHDLEQQLRESSARITKLEKYEPEIRHLKQEVSKLRAERDDKEQGTLAEYVEIKGIPESEDDLVGAVMCIAKAVNNPLQAIELVEISRTKAKKPNKEVLVKFAARETRDKFLAAARAKRPLTVHGAGLRSAPEESTHQLYINELLTGRKKQLLFNAKTFARQNNIRFCWTRRGQVFVRKTADSRPAVIKHELDLDTFFCQEEH